jgi:negative regulator of flagellin synthesis FlgM
MKIGNPAEKPAPPTLPAAVANGTPAPNGGVVPAPAATAIPETADASANIQLSNTASDLLATGTNPEFDAEKVARISKSIEDGSFKINPEAIADKLIANAQEVLNKVQS